jgi:hypothetical protein
MRASWNRRITDGVRSTEACKWTKRRLKELERENAKLKRLVSDLSLEKLVLKDIASGNF